MHAEIRELLKNRHHFMPRTAQLAFARHPVLDEQHGRPQPSGPTRAVYQALYVRFRAENVLEQFKSDARAAA